MSEFPYKIGGAIPSPVDPRDYVYGISEAVLPAEYLPEVKAAVHNQGQINNCATHALTACLENELGGSLAFNWYYGNRRYSDHKGQGTVERDPFENRSEGWVPGLAEVSLPGGNAFGHGAL